MVKSSSEKESLKPLKHEEIFEERVKKRIDELQNLSKHIDFNNSVYYFKGKSNQKISIGFKGQLGYYKNINDGNTTLGKTEKKSNKI